MEGQGRLKEKTIITIIVLFHVVGVAGFLMPKYQPLFIYLVPFHLVLMAMAVLYAYGRASVRMLGFFLIVYLLGYIAEWVGVHKNWLFGDYDYGPVLGRQVSRVPLLIGVNWFLLVFSTGALLQKTGINNSWLRIILGAALLTLLDVLIEPVAIRFNYWNWANDVIPVKNYICWFLVATVMLWLFEGFRFKRVNNAPLVLLLCQFIFFGVLNVF